MAGDILDRKVDSIGKLFDWFRADSIRFICLISILCNVWLANQLISYVKDSKNELIEEINKRVDGQLEKRIQPIQNSVDTTTERINNLLDERAHNNDTKK